jgi:hypothetical protein
VTGTGRGTGATPQQGAFQVVSLAARPELTLPALELLAVGWPEFMRHDPTAERHQARLATELAGFQALLVDREKDELAALGVSIPFAWDGPRPACRPPPSRSGCQPSCPGWRQSRQPRPSRLRQERRVGYD